MNGVPRTNEERAEVIRLYTQRLMTSTAISKRTGIPRGTVNTWTRGIHRIKWPPASRPMKWEVDNG